MNEVPTPEEQPESTDKSPAPAPPTAAQEDAAATVVKPEEARASKIKIKKRAETVRNFATRYQVPIITAVVGILLTITALRMIHYANPIADDNRVQENLSKFKTIRINQKTVQQIKSLNNSQTPTSTDINNNRTNPFAE